MIHSPFLKWMVRILGGVLAITSAKLTWDFGAQVGLGMALALLTVSILASYSFAIALEISNSGSRFAKPMFFAACVVGSIAFLADGVTNGSTVNVYSAANQHGASVQTVKHDLVHQKAKENRELLATFRKQLGDLETANPWAATVSADGLRAQLASHDKAIELEGARGGCKTRCLALMEKKAAVEKQIAIAEQSNALTSRIAALQKVVNGATDVAAATDKGFSVTQQRSLRLASLLTGTREPGDESTWWTDLVMWSIVGLIITMASAFCNTLGWVETGLGRAIQGVTEAVAPAEVTKQAVAEASYQPLGFLPTAHQPTASAALSSLASMAERLGVAGRTARVA